MILHYYYVANELMKISIPENICLDLFWEKFRVECVSEISKKTTFSLMILNESDFKYKRSKEFEICKLDSEMKFIVRNGNDLLYVSNDWSKAQMTELNNPFNLNFFIAQLFYTHVVQKRMIQVHSSLIKFDDNYGIMFLGPSGIGKTTQAELWNKYQNALIINGDMVFVEDMGEEFIGWGTPWHGSSSYCENLSVPIKALIVLKQGKENYMHRLNGFEMVTKVSKNIIYPMWFENGMNLALDTLEHLLRAVPVYELVNRADEESVLMVKQEVIGNEKN